MRKPNRPLLRRCPTYAVCAIVVAAASCGKDTAAPGPTSSVVFTTQPSAVIAGEFIEPPVEVMVRSASGRPLTGTVTLALDPNPCGWQLSGNLTAQVVDTTAVFGDLALDRVGRGYTLRATSNGVSATSAPFDVHSDIVTEPIVLEDILCLKPNLPGDRESLTYVPEDDSFWIADDDRNSLIEVERPTGLHRSQITLDTILAALPDAGQCDDGDADPNTSCSYVDEFEALAYDPTGRSLYALNTVDRQTDRPAVFRLTKEACAGCFTPESWQPLPVGLSYRNIIVSADQIYLALGGRIYPYDYDTNELATVDADGNSLPPTYEVLGPVVDQSFDGRFMWILTANSVLYQVEWDTRTERRSFDLGAFGFSLPRGLMIVRDTIYILEGDRPNPIYVLSQRQP